jgi:hypothetical protein
VEPNQGAPRDVKWRAWEHEREQMNMNESFLEYFVDVEGILKEYSLTHGIEYMTTLKNILPRVHG